jgi:GTPase SAR1 family protein
MTQKGTFFMRIGADVYGPAGVAGVSKSITETGVYVNHGDDAEPLWTPEMTKAPAVRVELPHGWLQIKNQNPVYSTGAIGVIGDGGSGKSIMLKQLARRAVSVDQQLFGESDDDAMQWHPSMPAIYANAAADSDDVVVQIQDSWRMLVLPSVGSAAGVDGTNKELAKYFTALDFFGRLRGKVFFVVVNLMSSSEAAKELLRMMILGSCRGYIEALTTTIMPDGSRRVSGHVALRPDERVARAFMSEAIPVQEFNTLSSKTALVVR